MFELDQIIVALWFLPVILFVAIPLAVTCLWLVFSPIALEIVEFFLR